MMFRNKETVYSFFVIMCFLFPGIVWGQKTALDHVISDPISGKNIREALAQLEQSSGIIFSYSSQRIPVQRKVQFTGKEKTIGDFLKKMFAGTDVQIIARKRKILLRPGKSAQKPNKKTQRLRKKVSYTLSGYIREAESGEALIGATVIAPYIGLGTHTNDYGFFSLSLPQGTHEVRFSYIGYTADNQTIVVNKNHRMDVSMNPGYALDEVVISAKEVEEITEVPSMNNHDISLEKVQTLPLLMGEKDVLKTAQLMPGVQSFNVGSNGLQVRGGGSDQNLMMLDGVPLYNTNHVLGFVSVFYGNSINKANLTKGGFSANQGGRLSSVMDVRMKEGNKKELHGEIGLGILSGSLHLEGPIIKDKTSFYLSARRTWLDAIIVPIQKAVQNKENRNIYDYHFYDVVAKVNHKLSPNDQLFLSGYWGDDGFKSEERNARFDSNRFINSLTKTQVNWGNLMAAIRWNHVWSPKLFTNTTLTYTRYRYIYESDYVSDEKRIIPDRLKTTYDLSSSWIEDLGVKTEADYYLNPAHTLRFGGGFTSHTYRPNVVQVATGFSSLRDTSVALTKYNVANEANAYLEDEVKLGSKWIIHPGLRMSFFEVESQLYATLQPRMQVKWFPNSKHTFAATYSRMVQFVHLLTNVTFGLPNDLWVPSTRRIRPQEADHYSLGYTFRPNEMWQIGIEGYYKEMCNLLEYQDGANNFNFGQDKSDSWEDRVAIGRGWSRGIELLVQKKKGKTTGWLGYTLARSDRVFPDLNEGKTFPYRYDRRHDISIAVTHKFNDFIDVGGVWIFGSGNPTTLGLEQFQYQDVRLDPQSSQLLLDIKERNNYRLRDAHRLDLAVNLNKKLKRSVRTWSFGMYNTYARRSPSGIYARLNSPQDISIVEVSYTPVLLPYASLRYKF